MGIPMNRAVRYFLLADFFAGFKLGMKKSDTALVLLSLCLTGDGKILVGGFDDVDELLLVLGTGSCCI